ncbi:sensor histidine kinase [Actinoplanes sp. NPDC026623]|uniref:sensor histidine kinase n=1 Tax=Actinoplanes sp. NPDC026623 TaxID=3155610 RepID=UPI0033F95B78
MPADLRASVARSLPAHRRPALWRLLDRLVAVVYGLPLTAYALVQDRPAAAVGMVAVTAALAERRRCPIVVLAVSVVLAPFSAPLWVGCTSWASALYLVAERRRLRVSLAALAVALLPAAVVPLGGSRLDAAGLSLLVLLLLVPVAAWTVGRAVWQKRRYAAAVRARHAAADAAHREQARRAVAEAERAVAQERLRLARELHDVISHTLSVVTVQASFGSLVFADRPELAREALTVVETAGREASGQLRRLLGVLRNDVGADRLLAPGLGGLDRLVADTARAGVTVGVCVTGDPRALPPGLDLTAYRIVQEALTNIVRHANTTAGTVIVHYGPDELTIEVTDPGRGTSAAEGGGHGLVGMRERVALHDGRVTAAPLPGRGFRVFARLPLGPGRADVAA